nr:MULTISPECIES: alpha/beta fold hydrolase [Yersinia]
MAEQSQHNIGTVTEKTILPPQHGLSEAGVQYLIRYRSISGVDGKTPREDTAAVFLPQGATPQGGWPVVVWAHGTVGIATHCAPSLNPRTPRDSQYLNTWLSLGFAVVAPDYAGLGSEGLHHYLNARAEAWSVLDSARAALSTFPLQNRLVLVGQSQGAHAAFASAGYQKTYAPKLNILATVVTGTPYFNATTSVQQVFGTSKTTGPDPKIPYAFYIYLSAEDTNPYLKAENYFQPMALPFLQQAREMCIVPLTEQVNRYSLNAANTLKPAIQTLLDTQIETMLYPTLHIEHPVFIGIGGDDINVPTAMQQRFASAVKASGTVTVVREYPGLDHSGTVNPSLRDSVPFVLKQIRGTDSINN